MSNLAWADLKSAMDNAIYQSSTLGLDEISEKLQELRQEIKKEYDRQYR